MVLESGWGITVAVLLSILGVAWICGYVLYLSNLTVELPTDKSLRKKMKFKGFQSLYVINPDRYQLRDGVVEMQIVENSMMSYKEPLTIYFSAVDTLRFIWWKRSKNSRETERRRLQIQRDAIELIYKDIAEFEKRNPILLKGEDLFK